MGVRIMWNALGGRKFLMAMIVMGVGTAVELATERGISQEFAGLLVLVYGSFAASNWAVSKAHMNKDKGKQIIQNSVDKKSLKDLKSDMAVTQNTVATLVDTTKNLHTLIVGAIQGGQGNQQVPR